MAEKITENMQARRHGSDTQVIFSAQKDFSYRQKCYNIVLNNFKLKWIKNK